ncbi:MAG: shikimate dehydrogenase [Chlorobium sp.]|uniref:shikimate dehydrogenase family protein n=1 Tax=Chlorobium sp. TaxID=1095 RepID=UPI0025C057FC|nr:shikimate dehydrogenase [Chlorobium sp.]MCF8216297.1 shikimate dehydrogenase [Chlorobium sp.]MCF8271199.1 shikimate dehydrogenase [Chlorobium sp.]MCF8287537.1 shikimate dehydrogenase [Chlorobium sp.]MCF8291112.1 shikimate dehydrogenase [Chlorobium sp.]MCF8385171.1 shikimate dehydrogenase [Chlorobium sp.]
MNTSRHILGLIGKNVDYSWSPFIHNTACYLLGLPYVYTIFNIAGPEQLPDALLGARALGISGFNVTIPYKKDVVPLLDVLSAEASAIQAVNTIVNKEGRLFGYNTDIEGFAAPLLPFRERIEGRPVSVFGSGGASLACIEAFRLYFRPSIIYLFVRDLFKGLFMLENYAHKDRIAICLLKDLRNDKNHTREHFRSCSAVVNATPIGTKGRTDDGMQCIVPDESHLLHAEQIVYDIVYNPLRTPLLVSAEQAGAVTISGIEMLIGQAARSFFLWTENEMPVDKVRSELLRHIETSSRPPDR